MAERIRIRMYHVGFGDCLLITFPDDKHMLIDCGVHLQDSDEMIRPTVENIKDVTNGRIHVVVGTHYHYDHICGFGKEADTFKSMTADEVWLPWTVDQSIPAVRAAFNAEKQLMRILEARSDPRMEEFKLTAVSNKDSLDTLKGLWGGLRPRLRFLPEEEGLSLETDSIPGMTVQFIGPLRDNPYLSKGDPGKDSYLADMENAEQDGRSSPFDENWIIRAEQAYSQFPTLKGKAPLEYNDLLDDFLSASGVKLNNSSLIMLIRYGGAAMLFPGDAEYGAWLDAYESTDLQAQLGDINLLKVSHHASYNGTPASLIDNMDWFVSMVSTKTIPSYPKIPKETLMEELDSHGPLIRSDSPPTEKKHYSKHSVVPGDFWTDVRLKWSGGS
jgi:hypothetical protein